MRRADGNSFEVAGISEQAADAYSDRAKELRDRFRELEAQYVRDHGHAPAKQARWALKQRAALETRDDPAGRPGLLDRLYRERIAAVLGQAGSVIAVDPHGGSRLILPGAATSGSAARVGQEP